MAAALRLLASLVFHLLLEPQSLASITSITVVTKLRLCRNPPGGFLGLQRRPLQLVDRPGIHDVRHLQHGHEDEWCQHKESQNLDVLHLLISFPFHR